MKAKRWSWIASLVALVSAPLQAQDAFCGPRPPESAYKFPHFGDDQLSFTVMDVGGMHVLVAEGAFGADEGTHLENALRGAGAVDEVWLSSPGGSVDSGLAFGRVLRKHGLMVRVPEAHACISACTLAFLGGALRVVDDGAFYGVHMFSAFFEKKDAKAQADRLRAIVFASEKTRKGTAEAEYQQLLMDIERGTAVTAGALARYLVEMSASLEFLTSMFGQTQLGVCYLNRPGLNRYNVTNIAG